MYRNILRDVVLHFILVTNDSPLTYCISHPCFIARENPHAEQVKENSKKNKPQNKSDYSELKPVLATASGGRNQARLHNQQAQH